MTVSQSFSISSSSCRAAIFPRCNILVTNGCLKSSLRGLLSVSALCVNIWEHERESDREKRGQVTSAHPYWFIVCGTTWGKHLLWRVSQRKGEHDGLLHHLKVMKPSGSLRQNFTAGKKLLNWVCFSYCLNILFQCCPTQSSGSVFTLRGSLFGTLCSSFQCYYSLKQCGCLPRAENWLTFVVLELEDRFSFSWMSAPWRSLVITQHHLILITWSSQAIWYHLVSVVNYGEIHHLL